MNLLTPLFYAATFVLSVALSLYLTPFFRRGAAQFGVLDQPDKGLKTHKTPIPYLGGIAVYISFILTLSIISEFDVKILGLLLGGTMITMVGLFDDLKAIPPSLKLIGQLIAVWVTLRSGITIQLEWLPIWVALPLTVFWLVGMTNAMNILDVSDGLASSVTVIAALFFAILALLAADRVMGATALALSGATLGFFRYNKAPASIYLGDAGSLFIGFMLGSLALIGAYTARGPLGAAAPLMILFVPLLETTLVSIARIAKGLSPMNGSRDHLALRLKARGWSSQQVVYAAVGTTTLMGAGAIVVTQASDLIALGIIGATTLIFLVLLSWLYFACPAPEERRARA
ncbi:undecaprenyl/decaprenyl-phosphate alpha-N-acetylglucosaminyl 1-phosphate transferase [Myxococcota bacterium]|nr:undecaprenyl/decaprenyl-phosphate alpha-N-acetylglucosaminyl 1-phosphate transferase [Myxococcota bacterium]